MKRFTKSILLIGLMCTFSIGLAQVNPVTNLQATFDGFATVNLSWTAPAGAEVPMTYTDGSLHTGVGYGESTPCDFYIAQRFPAEDLVAYQGLQLGKVEFVPYTAAATYTITVWVGDTLGVDSDGDNIYSPLTVAASQAVPTFTEQVYNEVVLNTPVAIPATGAMWIGVRCVAQAGYPAAADNGPAVIGKGDLIEDGGVFYDLADMGLNYNWCIIGFAGAATRTADNVTFEEVALVHHNSGTLQEDPNPAPARSFEFTCSYAVYEDTVQIGSSTLTNYAVALDAAGQHNYCVKVVTTEGESAPVCTSVNVPALGCGTPTDPEIVDYQAQYGEGVIAMFANEPVGAVVCQVVWVDNNNMVVVDWDATQYSGVLFQILTGQEFCFAVRAGCLFGNSTDTIWSALSDTVCVTLDLVCQPAGILNAQCTALNTVNMMWEDSPNAIAYNVYRDDAVIAAALEFEEGSAAYTDNDVPAGVHTYYITGICADGSESEPNTPVEVVVAGVSENNAQSAVVYPNPAKDSFKVYAEGLRQVTVSTILGQVVYETETTDNIVVVSTEGLENGIYMVTVETEDGSATRRINVVR